MTTEYQIVVNNRAGTQVAVITDMRRFNYSKRVNAPGMLVMDLDGGHSAIDLFDYDFQIEVWRRDIANGIAWYADFEAFWRDEERFANPDGLTTYRAFCPGQMDYLARSIVAYPAGTDARSAHTADPGETVLKNLVKYNATSGGTTGDGRVRNVDTWGSYISIDTDAAGGSTITYNCAHENLLSALQRAAAIAGGDFALVKTGAQAWEFRFYSGQLGTDRSASVTFALKHGNMGTPSLTYNRIREKTAAIVGGQGEGAARSFEVRTGTNHQATYNSREVFVSGIQYTTAAGLQSAGDAHLDEFEAKTEMQWEAIQQKSTRYGLHYFLGDLVTGYYQGVTATQQIVGVDINVAPSNPTMEEIRVITRNA
jgi:hypothetical protein